MNDRFALGKAVDAGLKIALTQSRLCDNRSLYDWVISSEEARNIQRGIRVGTKGN